MGKRLASATAIPKHGRGLGDLWYLLLNFNRWFGRGRRILREWCILAVGAERKNKYESRSGNNASKKVHRSLRFALLLIQFTTVVNEEKHGIQ